MVISVNVTNNMSFRTPVSLFGGLQDNQSYNVNATTQYWWDIGFPFFNVALYPTVTLEYRLVGEPFYSIATVYTKQTYNGLIEGLNSLYFGLFWYQFPTFQPAAGYQIYAVNDVYEFGQISF